MQVFRVKHALLSVLDNDMHWSTNVAVEQTGEVIVADASRVQKCIDLSIDGVLYLHVLHANLILEAI